MVFKSACEVWLRGIACGVLLAGCRPASFLGKVNHFPAFLVHFPAENVDFTAISPFFPGKVNHFAANQVHFPPEVNL